MQGQAWSRAAASAAPARLRFLTADDFPPFNSRDAGGGLAGFNVDLARAICAALDVEACTVEARPWAGLEDALLRGEGDAVIAGLAVSARSRGLFAFSRSYLPFPARFVMRRPALAAEPLWRALAGKGVGVVAGTAHERFLRDRFPGVSATSFPDAAAMVAALRDGSIEAAFGDGLRLSFWLGDGGACCGFAGGAYLDPGYFGGGMAIAVRGSDAELARSLDRALDALAAERTFAELYYRWFPVGFF